MIQMYHLMVLEASLVAQLVKNLPVMWEIWVHSLGREDPLEEEMATHSNTLVWRVPMDRGALYPLPTDNPIGSWA